MKGEVQKMEQELIKIDGVAVRQPDEGLGYDFETTYTADTTRTQDGVLHASAMFTVESLSYSATNVSAAEMAELLRLTAGGRTFTLHYFSPKEGMWRDGRFYVGKGSMSLRRLNRGSERADSISFRMTGVDPI